MPKVLGIDHVQLAMPACAEAKARAFYGELLGLAEREKPPRLAARGGCWFEDGGIRLHLGIDPDFQPARKAHPALLLDDLAGMALLLSAGGYPVTKDDPADTRETCFVCDPFGNRIELIQA